MSLSVESVLRDILVRHGTTLLGEQRRFEACIRDTHLSPREMNGVVAALKSGIPAHFQQFQSSGLTEIAIANYAKRLAEETGLNEELARTTLEAWARALRVDLPAKGSPQADAGPPKRSADRTAKDAPKTPEAAREDATPPSAAVAVPAASSSHRADWRVWLLVIIGFVLVAGQGYRFVAISIATYITGSFCIIAAALVLRQAAWVKWPAIALCSVTILLAISGLAILGVPAPPLIIAGCLAVAGAIGLLLWRTEGLPPDNPVDRVSVVVLLAALWRIFSLAVALGGIVFALTLGNPFHQRLLWLWLNLPVSLALVWLAWSVLSGRRMSLPRLFVTLLLAASVLLSVADLIALAADDPNVSLPYHLRIIPMVGILADLVVAALVIFQRKREDARPKETALA
ncbi:hypothetical protein [Chelatococcus asaccharovorans]|uniref:hypothetical protein n=1 Tax=Chelatococcus asaccharovorans TaxID=28210 RepID=UPI00224C7043|nr:hypothetical protein [Chelatococcus asaccharovorans]CAH1648945.1 conserved membrane hypothetical protein [Chelatococcus asaccharovorans]CAH1687275.1 conserved membrane hypothetical protein [Chelatococcus asaccharovorans]